MSISCLSLCLGCENMTLEENGEFLFFQLHLGLHRGRGADFVGMQHICEIALSQTDI